MNAGEINPEVLRWRKVGAKLWPFVRPWGLCGAHPDAIDAVEELAELLGVNPKYQNDANVAYLERKRVIEEVATFFQSKWFRKMHRKDAEDFLEQLRGM